MRAWDSHEAELRGWLQRRLNNPHDAEDLLQDLFIKALRQDKKFCEISNARAWLFEVARNTLADRLRMKREQIELPEDLAAEHDGPAAVETLAGCLPRALARLPEADREAITRCDPEGMRQQDYARL
ncbi:MAG: sigma-70 family RNA polymerase sigma factor, partial [Gammaproteobacteria bacterium]|nr:sigma-70 family RNA polymerase sigma factor [Gammaproteobacteria bacterium]